MLQNAQVESGTIPIFFNHLFVGKIYAKACIVNVIILHRLHIHIDSIEQCLVIEL